MAIGAGARTNYIAVVHLKPNAKTLKAETQKIFSISAFQGFSVFPR
jgi:hypothetical protein